ncbi:uncharacterized protein AC631_02666 [Debaryomyces fabryi]|uniref:MATE efflux family protein n=1 Tax=Debaryomyces fabryi TaxID=58627 RepID=A0A0V1PZB2_9ASCO|nr:uncharacterized protein AC631_02666 [Debaryomyces fabryi]KSA01591.1 hypothetical protein AC631_02666 [Debaryomyces fabryi]CUM49868.1 unnamed protein product [Debaryomyces fabryi]
MVLFRTINRYANPNGGLGLPVGGRRRRLFIPPSTNRPLFSYGEGDDQRSFLSLGESGSVLTQHENDVSDAASVSTSRSLPSTLKSTNEDQESFHSWLLEEHQRRYSAANSEDDDYNEDNRSRGSGRSGSLLNSSSRSSQVSGKLTYNELEDFANLHTTFSIEMKMLVRYAFPLVITFLLEHFFSIVCLLVVGHIGKNELAAVSLATMSSTITFAIFEGIATALDTLCPQAYGAGNYELVGIHVQRCIMFSFVVYIPCGFLWWYSANVLKFIIDSEEVLYLTSSFLRILILGAPAYIIFENSKRFLQAQGIFEAGTGILVISLPINVLLSTFLVWNKNFGLGFIGAPIATVINFWFIDILLVMYVMFVDGDKCWYGIAPIKELFQQWGSLSHLAIPGIVMIESEYMAYEIMTLFASYFGTTELAAQSAVLSIASLSYMVPFAISIAASTRIANFIGGQNMASAKMATKSSLALSVIAGNINFLILFTFKRQIAKLFTKDEGVTELIVALFNPLVAVLEIFDGIASVANGVLRAQGLQKIGGIINFFVYYAFAIPLAIVLSRVADLKLLGLWLGLGSGMILIGLSETIVVFNSDWDKILMNAGLMNETYLDVEESIED